ncbi:MAG: NADPH-dependent F420 reductase [Methanotrichaceae archaeon]
MKIGIIGSGNVGSALGKIWGRSGHDILFSSRHPEELKSLAESIGKNVCYGTPAEAAKFGEVVILAVPWTGVKDALKSAGSFNGKILIDCTNPLKPDMSGLAVEPNTSAAEEVAKMAKDAHVVKAFNTTFAAVMKSESRMFGSVKPVGFYCGGDDSAKTIVSGLIGETGLEPVDTGPLMNARCLESMAMLIIQLAFVRGMGNNMAYALLRR